MLEGVEGVIQLEFVPVEDTGILLGVRHEENDRHHAQRRVQSGHRSTKPENQSRQHVGSPVGELHTLLHDETDDDRNDEESDQEFWLEGGLGELDRDDDHPDSVVKDGQQLHERAAGMLRTQHHVQREDAERDVSCSRNRPTTTEFVTHPHDLNDREVGDDRPHDSTEGCQDRHDCGLAPHRTARKERLEDLLHRDCEEERHPEIVDQPVRRDDVLSMPVVVADPVVVEQFVLHDGVVGLVVHMRPGQAEYDADDEEEPHVDDVVVAIDQPLPGCLRLSLSPYSVTHQLLRSRRRVLFGLAP